MVTTCVRVHPDNFITDMTGFRLSSAHATTVQKARRNLFGPVDHDEVERFLKEQIRKHQEEAAKFWNFDFDREVPQAEGGGQWNWEKVNPCEVPAAYGRICDGPMCVPVSGGGREDDRDKVRLSPPQRQTTMLDYMKVATRPRDMRKRLNPVTDTPRQIR